MDCFEFFFFFFLFFLFFSFFFLFFFGFFLGFLKVDLGKIAFFLGEVDIGKITFSAAEGGRKIFDLFFGPKKNHP